MIRGNLGSYYKIQTDYHTPLDSATATERHGANNRSKQRARTKGELGLIALGGEESYEGTKWYRYISVFSLSLDADDPDNPNTENGQREARLENKEMWFRYAPHAAVGFKIGSQTVKATANPVNNYIFEGDFDQDYVYYAASTLLEVPGISMDLHLSKNVEFGLGVFEGASDGSLIAAGAGGEGSGAQSIAGWGIIQWKALSLQGAYQSVKLGDEVERFDPDMTGFGQKYKHTVLNLAAKLALFDGKASPYFGYQKLSGDKANVPFASANLLKLSELLDLGIIEESRNMTMTATSVGWVSTFSRYEIALDYTRISTPGFNQPGSVNAAIGLASAIQTNFKVELQKGVSFYLFFHSISAKEDAVRSAVEQTARDNEDTVTKYGDIVKEEDLGKRLIDGVEALEWTKTRSFGLGFKVNFGNNVF